MSVLRQQILRPRPQAADLLALRRVAITAEPASIAAFGPLHDSAGREFLLTASRPLKDDLLVVRVKGVADRDAAQKLTHVKLFIAREKLPPPDEDEFYCRDLIGLRAETRDGVLLGTIVAVPKYGAGDLLEVAPPAGETLLFPFTRAVVPQIDLAGGRVIVEPPREVDAGPEADA